eukprot:TRINITY_DN111603_c0_g1_i1.p1 TRINITY_DN111603_c0_g1~~TRINITY_DN111603_c0_g1_i1.p1  ORF type:complete len:259 (-),score=67.11 TRINITY_DN111603_c0_g1_i1:267-1043(-)
MVAAPRRRVRLAVVGVLASATVLVSRPHIKTFVEPASLQRAEEVVSQVSSVARRDLLLGGLDASLLLSLGEPGGKAQTTEAEKLQQALYLMSRAQEATVQQERFISKVDSQEVVKKKMSKALKMADSAYRLVDQVVFATKFVDAKNIVSASQAGNEAVDAWQGAMDYIGDSMQKGDVTDEQRSYLRDSMRTTRDKLFEFLAYMPQDKVAEVRKIIEDENVINRADAETAVNSGDGSIDKSAGVFNPVTLPWKDGFTAL